MYVCMYVLAVLIKYWLAINGHIQIHDTGYTALATMQQQTVFKADKGEIPQPATKLTTSVRVKRVNTFVILNKCRYRLNSLIT